MYRGYIMVCSGPNCGRTSDRIAEEFEVQIKIAGLRQEIQVIRGSCMGLCSSGPNVIMFPEGTIYSHVQIQDAARIVNEHLLKGNRVEELLYDETKVTNTTRGLDQTEFFQRQTRVALRNCGVIDPQNIEEYIAVDGYAALYKVLTEMSPDEVIDTVLESGLQGRGGAGFPTGMKWKFASGNRGQVQKYVCCNADEGDPGAFMDRSILEGNPHTVIGADKGYIYVRAEYPVAVKHLSIAIEQAKERGLLGEHIFDTPFNFDLEIKLGAGAFVCGEETALMTSIEGKRGEPHTRPPFPAVKGLFESPTILNNVETYANICQIILNGPQWYQSIGSEKSKGTKVFALGGKIKNTGLVEVPMGTTLREIIEEIGGGIPRGKKFKAAQTGGPSGGCIPDHLIDTPMDYDNLLAIGTMMGSGGLIVMDEDTCMVDIAKFFLEFTVDVSCGKCTPCRVGTKRLLELLNKITQGQGTMEDLDRIEELASFIKSNSLCGLGQTAPNPVLSTLRYFRDEYVEHIQNKRCPAKVCRALLTYQIDPAKCKGCTACVKACPADAIIGSVKNPHKIDVQKCIKCGSCIDKCRFDAISRN